jgi:cytoskeletal protein CcmA (bactofilin family)
VSAGPNELEATPPLVPAHGLFEGQVAVVGETLIAGAVHGSLKGPGTLELLNGSRIEGVIECDVVECRGAVVGLVAAHRRVHLAAGTHFEGDLEAPALEVDDAAVWNGIARVGR